MKGRFVIKTVSKELVSEYNGTYIKVEVQDIVNNNNFRINIGTTNKKAVISFKPYFEGLTPPDKHGNRHLVTDKIIPEAIFEINYFIQKDKPNVIQPTNVKFVGYTPDKHTTGVQLF